MDYQSEISSALGKFSKHYENFPVASFLIPPKKRFKIKLLYWFARTADDIADEGTNSPDERLCQLDYFQTEFIKSINKYSELEFMNLLGEIVVKENLTQEYFLKLLSAFRQDIVKNRYHNFREVLDYCSRSANPVGRLVLEVFNYRNEEIFNLSDKICTSLQLINFLQDTTIDLKRNRLYYPIDEFKNFNLSDQDFFSLSFNSHMREYIKFNIKRIRGMMNQGKALVKYLKGRFAIEIKWTILGGEEILNKIEKNNFNVMTNRPTISKFDYSKILFRSLLNL